MASQTPYIRDGRITRDRPILHRLSTLRIAVVLSILAVLIITNPVNNELHSWLPRDLQAKGSYRQHLTTWITQTPKVTNYGVVGLEKSFAAIRVVGLSRTADVCSFDSSSDDLSRAICTTIADNLCHRKPLFDWNDLPYSTCQVMSILLIGSILLSFCAFGLPVLRATRYPFIDSILSMFHGVSIVDVVRWNVIGYPALRSMRRLLSPTGVYLMDGTEFIRVHFSLGCILLILGVGGTANYIGNRFNQGQRVEGIDGLLAACLGYNVAVGKWVLFSFLSVRVTNTTYFWLEVVHLFISGRYGSLIAVLAGGTLGHVFGIMHHQWFVEYVELFRLEWRRFFFGR